MHLEENNMVDFILKENPFSNMKEYLTKKVEAFRIAIEYEQLTEYERNNNSVICVAFRKFWGRIIKSEYEKSLGKNDSDVLNSCYLIINELASSEHPEGQRILYEEIFYNLVLEEVHVPIVYSRLNIDAKKIFDSFKTNQ